MEPYVPIAQQGNYKENFFAEYYFFEHGTGHQGYDITGKQADKTKEVPVLDFKTEGAFADGISEGFPPNFFAAVYTGQMEIMKPGEYTFMTKSDDGSRVYINQNLVVDNWGLHGPKQKQGKFFLKQGVHDVRVTFFENAGGAYLTFRYNGPDTDGKTQFVKGWHEEV